MLLVVDKPTGYTSFDLVRKLKKIYRWEKIGHAWTLDPLATWIMLIAIWKDTKKLSQLVGLDKSYTARIDFSKLTDTWDYDSWEWESSIKEVNWNWVLDATDVKQCSLWGYKHLLEEIAPVPSKEQLEEACASLVWEWLHPLTPFSAKKLEGKKLYEYARQGNPVHRDIPMAIRAVRVVDFQFPYATVEFDVGSWTYIRSLAYEIGKKLWRWWALTALRRTAVGRYRFDD